MKILNDQLTELTPHEMECLAEFHAHLDIGHGIVQAADEVDVAHPELSPEFIAWLKR